MFKTELSLVENLLGHKRLTKKKQEYKNPTLISTKVTKERRLRPDRKDEREKYDQRLHEKGRDTVRISWDFQSTIIVSQN